MGRDVQTQNDKWHPIFEGGLSSGNDATTVAARSGQYSASRIEASRAAGLGAMEVGGRNQVKLKLFGNAAASDVDLYGEKEVEGGGYTLEWLGSITPTLGEGDVAQAMPGCGVADAHWVDEATVTGNGNGAIGTDGVETRPATGGANITTVFRIDAQGFERIVVRVPSGMNGHWYGF